MAKRTWTRSLSATGVVALVYADSEAKERIRESLDIVELVSAYGFQLRQSGSNFVTHCPWHNDTRPSLQINRARQSWKCWPCDKGGDIYSFVMEIDKVDFREALELLAERAGVPLGPKQKNRPKPVAGSPNDKKTLYRALAWAEDFFHHYLVTDGRAEGARQYLADRQIDQSSIDNFHLGMAPNESLLLKRANSAGFSPEVLLAAGLANQSSRDGSYFDFFRNRLMFSIRNPQGAPIAFGGRVLPGDAADAPKYINTRETAVFAKHRQFYALDVARNALRGEKHLIVMEGYTDVVVAHQYGITNAIAVLGTALGAEHVHILKRFADRVTLVLDGDEAGQRRTGEVLEQFISQQVDLRILTLPEGKDPCDFVMEEGAEEFQRRIASAPDALEHKVQSATAGIDLIRDTDRANRALESILVTFAKAPRLSTSTTHDYRLREEQLLARVARGFAVSEDQLRRRLRELRADRPSSPVAEVETPVVVPSVAEIDPLELELLEVVSHEPSLVELVLGSKLDVTQIKSEQTREVLRTIEQIATVSTVDFSAVLTDLPSSQLKNIWVTCAELADRKSKRSMLSSEARLLAVIEKIKERHGKQLQQITEAQLPNMSIDEQKQHLLALIDARRADMGSN